MLNKSIIEKIVAVFLIFTLTFANFALVTESYASTIFESVFLANSDTESKNVMFDAYFEETEKEKSYSAISAVFENSVNIAVKLEILEVGYLKNAQIEICEISPETGLSFEINSGFDENNYEYIKSIDDNKICLKQINNNSELNLNIPITYKQEKYVSLDRLKNAFKVVLTGDYVNKKGKSVSVQKSVELELTWLDIRDIKLNSKIEKYVPYTLNDVNGIILQNKINIDYSQDKYGAVKSENLVIEAPIINNRLPKIVNIIRRTTNSNDLFSINEENLENEKWNYQNGILTINNEIIEEYVEEDKVLDTGQDDKKIDTGQKEVIDTGQESQSLDTGQNKKYICTSGSSEYLITYIYESIDADKQKIKSNVSATIKTFGVEDIVNNKEISFEYDISEKIGDVITSEIECSEGNVSKGYMYYKYIDQESNELEIKFKDLLNISYKDLVDEIIIQDDVSYYKDKNDNSINLNDMYYKEISIPKDNFDRVLGKDGVIVIETLDGTMISEIKSNLVVENESDYKYKFDSLNQNNIRIKISRPICEGSLILNISKVQKLSEYDKEKYKTFEKMILKYKHKYKYLNEKEYEETFENRIVLDNTITKPELEFNTKTIRTIEPTNVVMRIKLNNETINSDIYGNSNFEIILPDGIKEFKVKDYNIIYSNGLKIKDVQTSITDDGKYKIGISLEGIQTKLSPSVIKGGTTIVLNTNIILDEFSTKSEKNVEFYYENSEATNYFGEGKRILKIGYSPPEGVVSVNIIKSADSSISTIYSVNQGAKIATLPINSKELDLNMELMIMNNSAEKISNICILGRAPVTETKDIFSEDNLEVTKDAYLTSKIIPDENNDTNFTIYYSPNGKADTDLNSPDNKWTEDMDLEKIKSYMIIPKDLSYELDESGIIKFSYTFKIPENLEFNEKFCGDFGVYFTKESVDTVQEEISLADFIYLQTGENPELTNEDNFVKQDITNNTKDKNKTEDESNIIDSELSLENNINTTTEQISKEDKTPDNSNKLTGSVWIDSNSNGIKDEEENVANPTKVNLVDAETGYIKDTQITDSSGEYSFDEIDDGNYLVMFEYESDKYSLADYQKEDENLKNNSNVVEADISQNGNEKFRCCF